MTTIEFVRSCFEEMVEEAFDEEVANKIKQEKHWLSDPKWFLRSPLSRKIYSKKEVREAVYSYFRGIKDLYEQGRYIPK